VGAAVHGEAWQLFYSFLISRQSVGLLGLGISSPQGRYVHRTTRTSLPRVGFEPTTPVLERAKTFHALDCTAIVIGYHRDSI
jgi:hypothetical protein